MPDCVLVHDLCDAPWCPFINPLSSACVSFSWFLLQPKNLNMGGHVSVLQKSKQGLKWLGCASYWVFNSGLMTLNLGVSDSKFHALFTTWPHLQPLRSSSNCPERKQLFLLTVIDTRHLWWFAYSCMAIQLSGRSSESCLPRPFPKSPFLPEHASQSISKANLSAGKW